MKALLWAYLGVVREGAEGPHPNLAFVEIGACMGIKGGSVGGRIKSHDDVSTFSLMGCLSGRLSSVVFFSLV